LATGDRAFAAYSPVPELGWGVLVEVPVDEALADLEQLKRRAAVAAGALAILLVVAVFVAARVLARPLLALAQAARRAASGGLGEVVPIGGTRETADLARTFNGMSLALKAAQDGLEQRIADRTRDLQRSREFAELLLNSIDQNVTVMDRDFRIVSANRRVRTLHGDGIVGQRCHQAFAHRTTPCEACPVLRAIETRRPASAERPAFLIGNEEILRQEAFPVVSPDGEIEAAIEVARIVTAERSFQAQLMHHERMAAFGLLAAGVAHEIGNPLASIQSQLHRARESGDGAVVEATLGIVEKQITRIASLLRDLVSSARPRPTEVTCVSLNQVLDDVARMLAHDRRARGISIEVRPATLPAIDTREDLVMQVLLNLAINALDAMDGAGTLELSTAVEGGRVLARVRDTAAGVPEIVRQRLFEPFFTTKAPGRGTGLGLYVSRGIVESLGGELELERSGSDGTTFVLSLPCRQAAPRET
jgi:C4-dicarboxylate-specific signal transduction histidine kinase